MGNTFNENRIFGVEIEFLATLDRFLLAQKIRDYGVNCSVEGYNHNDNDTYWKIVTDASCGYEIVSPRLKGQDGLNQITIVCKALNEMNAKADKHCGLHVHHDARDFKISNFRNIFINYIKFERVIDSMMPVSRRGNDNGFCKSLRAGHYIVGTEQEAINNIKNAQTVEQLEAVYNNDRYYKVNLQSFVRHGSVEFRQHSGTIDATKIINWVVISQAFVNASFSTVKAKYNEKYTNAQVLAIALKMQPYQEPDEMTNAAFIYMKKRIKELAKEVA